MKDIMINGGRLRMSDIKTEPKDGTTMKQDLMAAVEKFVQTVVDEQKAQGASGDETYISEGEAALFAIKLLKQVL